MRGYVEAMEDLEYDVPDPTHEEIEGRLADKEQTPNKGENTI